MPAKIQNEPRKTNLNRLDLNLLRVFIEVFDTGGVTAASATLHLSQPALSNSLTRLRAALGDALFVRQGIALKPTPFAQKLAPAVRQALTAISAAIETEPSFNPATADRRFNVAMTDAGQMVFLPKIALALRLRSTSISLQAVTLELGGALGAQERLSEALADGSLDCAIGPLSDTVLRGLSSVKLFSETYVGLVAPKSSLAAGPKKLSLTTLKKTPIVLVEQLASQHRVIGEALSQYRLNQNIICRVPLFSSAVAMLDVYDALTIVPSQIGVILQQERRAVVVTLPLKLGQYPVSLVTHKRYQNDSALIWFSDLVRECLVANG